MRKKNLRIIFSSVLLIILLSTYLVFFPNSTRGASVSWDGGGADNNWETSANWSDDNVPAADDDVTIDADVTVDINSTTTINSLVLGDAEGTYSPTLNFDYDAIENGALNIDDGDLTIYSGATVTHTIANSGAYPWDDEIVGRINIDIESGDATIGGTINTDEYGYAGATSANDGDGPGGGLYIGAESGGGGGGYGGEGGDGTRYSSQYESSGSTYGSLTQPTDLGSGGGRGSGAGSGDGGNGGGAIKLSVSQATTVNGSISSDGENGSGKRPGGAGSGGSVYLTTATLAGSGTIQALGGNGIDGNNEDSGNGGGGRILISYSETNSFSGTISANKGSGGIGGENGTVYIIDSTNNDLYIKNTQYWNADPDVEGQTHSFSDVVVEDNATLYLKGYYSTDSNGYGFVFNVDNLSINSGSSISADYYGYAGATLENDGDGPGGGLYNGADSGGGGGGYGGEGGDGTRYSSQYESGGPTYGSLTQPTDLGSGGGSGSGAGSSSGAAGGGAIKIEASDTVTVSGILSSNGEDVTTGARPGGAGSGGSIYISTNTLAGSGTIETIGGNGLAGSNEDSGNGGGGRISINYITTNWSGNSLISSVATASGSGGVGGADGTVNINEVNPGYITNLDSDLDMYLASDWTTDLEQTGNSQTMGTDVGIKDHSTGKRLAEFDLFFDSNLDMTGVTAGSSKGKAFFHIPGGFSTIDGYNGGTYSLYVPKETGNRVGICPNADSLEEIDSACPSAEYYTVDDSNVGVVTVEGTTYWKVSGLTSTGGFTVVENATDTMSRLEVGVDSNHEIVLPTDNGISDTSHTITVEFDPDGQNFDLSSITLSDIDLEDDGVDIILASSPSSGAWAAWGVTINTTTDIITFTPQDDIASNTVEAGSTLTIEIGTNADSGVNQITNPSTAGSYEIHVRMNNTSDGGEFAEMEVPIVDDDTVNVTSFLDSSITFDIDTSSSDTDCDSLGGTSPCNSHSGISDSAGYVLDLGELSATSVSSSGDTVMHADGNSGDINYIFFNITTNANSGAVVTVLSANGALIGPGSETIDSVTNDGDGVLISAGDGAYGIREVTNSTTSGTFSIAGDYDGTTNTYGSVASSTTTIFTSNSGPIQDGRLQLEVGISPSSTNATGTYSDTLTFVATGTF